MSVKLKNNKDQKKPIFASTLITLIILVMLILSGPANAVSVFISGLMSSYTQDSFVNFTVNITISDPDRYVPAKNITVNVTGRDNFSRTFYLNGTPLSGSHLINITPISTPLPGHFGPGYGYGVENGYGYDFGYGYGYGYNNGAGGSTVTYIYNVSISSTTLPVGKYFVKANLNTGNSTKPAFSSDLYKFDITPTIQITKENINPRSNSEIEVAILSSEGFNSSSEINISTVMFGPSRAPPFFNKTNMKDVNGDGYLDLIVKFHTRDAGIECGMTSATLYAKTHDGIGIEGSDTFTTVGCGGGGNGGSGDSTGGGGVTTPEPAENIVKHETRDCNVLSGKPSSCKFSVPEHWVSELIVTGKENEIVTFRIEALKGLSKKVPVPAPGTQYLNIWPDSKRVKDALIRFRVENSWIASEGLTSETLRMYRWDGTKWNELETRVLSKDASATNYEAKTDAFAYFAITGPKAATGKGTETTAAPTVTAPGGTTSAAATAPPVAQQPIHWYISLY